MVVLLSFSINTILCMKNFFKIVKNNPKKILLSSVLLLDRFTIDQNIDAMKKLANGYKIDKQEIKNFEEKINQEWAKWYQINRKIKTIEKKISKESDENVESIKQLEKEVVEKLNYVNEFLQQLRISKENTQELFNNKLKEYDILPSWFPLKYALHPLYGKSGLELLDSKIRYYAKVRWVNSQMKEKFPEINKLVTELQKKVDNYEKKLYT